jgi:hypothetical protein
MSFTSTQSPEADVSIEDAVSALDSGYDNDNSQASQITETRLVIAVDYGTTYTGKKVIWPTFYTTNHLIGVAYATPYGDRVPLNEVTIVQNWVHRQSNSDKIPSVFSFSERSEEMEQQWGFDLSPGAVAMVQTKLELDHQTVDQELELLMQNLEGMHNLDTSYIIEAEKSPVFTYKSAEEVVTEYLTRIFEYVLSTVERFNKKVLENTSTNIVITIPTVNLKVHLAFYFDSN